MTARAALFGSGSLLVGLISQVHIGGTGTSQIPYRNINEILKRLGIVSSPHEAHQNHFHIYLRPPAPKEIGYSHNLLADASQLAPVAAINSTPADTSFASSPDALAPATTLQTDAQGLLDYTQTLTDTGEEIMFTMNVPYVPMQDIPIVLVQAATPSTTAAPADYLYKTCMEGSVGGANIILPAAEIVGELASLNRESITSEESLARESTVRLTLLEDTTHGKLILQPRSSGRVSYEYQSAPGYAGKDKAIFLAEYAGKRYKIVYNLISTQSYDENFPHCPPSRFIKLQNKPASGYNQGSITITLANLPGGAVGQDSGNNITLDTNAAGYGWFIDTTPADNSEFLPTSSPNVWIAKAGSAAYGKMDMLSVLMHEHGH